MEREVNADSRPMLAVLGGGGFVGARLAQLVRSSGRFRAVPVLRTFRGLARLGPAVPEARIVDTQDPEALCEAFRGAQTVVNLTMGDLPSILQDTQLIYRACVRAKVGQLIHMSSAVVFGRVEDQSINDDSDPDTRSWMLYARGKARAEVWLREQMEKRELQTVVLRPGLIWGPCSNWSEMVGDQLLHGRAALSNQGNGIANLIFVDNLVRIILAIASHRSGPSGCYNVGDNEAVTWERYYSELAARLGYARESVRLWPDNRFRIGPKHAVEWCLEQPALLKVAKGILKRVGPGTKTLIKAKLKGSPEPPGGGGGSAVAGPPILSRAQWALQNILHPLPTAKIHRDFGPLDLLPFGEALNETAAWLKFAGFAASANVPSPAQAVPRT